MICLNIDGTDRKTATGWKHNLFYYQMSLPEDAKCHHHWTITQLPVLSKHVKAVTLPWSSCSLVRWRYCCCHSLTYTWHCGSTWSWCEWHSRPLHSWNKDNVAFLQICYRSAAQSTVTRPLTLTQQWHKHKTIFVINGRFIVSGCLIATSLVLHRFSVRCSL